MIYAIYISDWISVNAVVTHIKWFAKRCFPIRLSLLFDLTARFYWIIMRFVSSLVHSSIAHGSMDLDWLIVALMPTLGIFQQHFWVDIRNQIDKTIHHVKKNLPHWLRNNNIWSIAISPRYESPSVALNII
jgi:hypothetical protein